MAAYKRNSNADGRSPKRLRKCKDDLEQVSKEWVTSKTKEYITPRKALSNTTNTPIFSNTKTSKVRRESRSATENRRRSQRITKSQYCTYTGRRILSEVTPSRSVSDKASQITPSCLQDAEEIVESRLCNDLLSYSPLPQDNPRCSIEHVTNDTIQANNIKNEPTHVYIHPILEFIGDFLVKVSGSLFGSINNIINNKLSDLDNVVKSVSSEIQQ